MTTSSITRLVPKPGVVICGRCPATTPITETARAKADEVAGLAYVEQAAANYAARDAGWTFDYETRANLCGPCAAIIATERRDPCPEWCNSCCGYDFIAEGTSHEHLWIADDGQVLGEVRVLVTRGEERSVSVAAGFERAIGDFDSISELRATAQVANDIADFLEKHDLVIGEAS